MPQPVELAALRIDADLRHVVGQQVGLLRLAIERHAVKDHRAHLRRTRDGDLDGDVGAGVGAVEIAGGDAQRIERAHVRAGEVRQVHLVIGGRGGIAIALVSGAITWRLRPSTRSNGSSVRAEAGEA